MNYIRHVMNLALKHDLESDEPSESYELKSATSGLIKQQRRNSSSRSGSYYNVMEQKLHQRLLNTAMCVCVWLWVCGCAVCV